MTYEEWYERLKAAPGGLSIHVGDLSGALESALRRRARRDGKGLSISRPNGRGDECACSVSLFTKGTTGPGREAYLAGVQGGAAGRLTSFLHDVAESCPGDNGDCSNTPCYAREARELLRRIKRDESKILTALSIYAEANFEAGEWDRNESDEPYSRVHGRVERAEAKLRALLGLPPKVPQS